MGSIELTSLEPASFEHLVNALALRVLGAGVFSFSPGPDGGRDGLFLGRAAYPSSADCWEGTWYIQSKFHAPKASGDEQKWLLKQIKSELKLFANPENKREWPDIWIVATNIDPSGVPATGAFDQAKTLVKKSRPELADRFHIWGGSKILDLLSTHGEVAKRYGHFLTPGHVLAELRSHLQDSQASVDRIVDYLITEAIEDQQFAKLEQAGSAADRKPGIHRLFVDLPFSVGSHTWHRNAFEALSFAAKENHRVDSEVPVTREWDRWRQHPDRARVWVFKGGPGQGKSTIGQYFCQVQRAALVLGGDADLLVPPETRRLAEEIRKSVESGSPESWPSSPRIPLLLELKDYAQWFVGRDEDDPKGITSYVAARIKRFLGLAAHVGTLERALTVRSWVVVFDGLDEVPSDVKSQVGHEIERFLRRASVQGDVFAICTSRPQGYTGQFDNLNGVVAELDPLPEEVALGCAEPLIRWARSKTDGDTGLKILTESAKTDAVKSLMQTPLQAHIMAVIVREGRRPPKMKWRLYQRFYEVIFNRERIKDHVDPRLNKVFAEDEDLLTRVHDHAGFVLHARAERAKGSEASLTRPEFEEIVQRLVDQHKEADKSEIVASLMLAAKERLVLLTTPESGGLIRYDVRQLQEFFAARFLFHDVEPDELDERLRVVAGDVHWREVMHFLMSALVEGKRRHELAIAIDVLEWLDRGPDDEEATWFYRRLARGAGIAARLLEDGVLEASVKDRNRFRECLRPLLATDSASALKPLSDSTGEATRNWLNELLLEHVKTRRPSEALGAMRLLWDRLSEGDPGVEALQQALVSVPESVFNWADSEAGWGNAWQTSVVLKLLRSKDLIRVARTLTDHPDLGTRFRHSPCYESENDERRIAEWALETILPRKTTIDFQWVSFEKNGWTAETSVPLVELARRASPEAIEGLASLFRAILRLRCWGRLKDLRLVLQMVLQQGLLEEKPLRIGGLYLKPCDRPVAEKVLRVLDLKTEEDLEGIWEPNLLPVTERQWDWLSEIYGLSRGGESGLFLQGAKQHPKAALIAWNSSSLGGTHDSERVLSKLVEILEEDLVPAGKLVSPLLWHLLVHRSEVARTNLLKGCSVKDTEIEREITFFGQLSKLRRSGAAFALRFPAEAKALLAVGSALVESIDNVNVYQLAAEFVGSDVTPLALVADDKNAPLANRLGAVMVGVLHPQGRLEFASSRSRLLICASKNWPRTTERIALALTEWELSRQEIAGPGSLLSSMIAELPLETSQDFRWHSIFHRYRQRSRAPVSECGKLDAWLNYNPD